MPQCLMLSLSGMLARPDWQCSLIPYKSFQAGRGALHCQPTLSNSGTSHTQPHLSIFQVCHHCNALFLLSFYRIVATIKSLEGLAWTVGKLNLDNTLNILQTNLLKWTFGGNW